MRTGTGSAEFVRRLSPSRRKTVPWCTAAGRGDFEMVMPDRSWCRARDPHGRAAGPDQSGPLKLRGICDLRLLWKGPRSPELRVSAGGPAPVQGRCQPPCGGMLTRAGASGERQTNPRVLGKPSQIGELSGGAGPHGVKGRSEPPLRHPTRTRGPCGDPAWFRFSLGSADP